MPEINTTSDDANMMIAICRGGDVCEGSPGWPCQWCYWIAADDPRDTKEIIAASERQH